MMPRNSMPLIEREIVCTYKIKLEKVLGVTVSSNSALHSSPNGDLIAYPAGCTVVLFNTQTGEQNHIVNTNRKSITSLAFSSCGRYLVTGEFGHQPAVRVWDLQSDPQSTQPGLFPQPQQIAEFQSHKYGICCVAFSPSNKFVVSIGTQHDMIVNVWDWRNNVKVASNKVSMKVKALAFAENGSYFVTVGNRHVKFWFLEYGKAKYTEAVPLMGRSAILGVQRNNYFCDVACGRGQCGDSTYAVTRSGLLCEFNNRRLLDKWVELRTTSANCIVIGEKYIFVGCAEGIVRCFDPITLHFVTTLPRTHYLGVDVSSGLAIQHMSSPPSEAKYPDTIAATYDETNNKLTCIYNDHSIYIWDVHNIRRVGKSHSFLFHSACIWGVEMAPPSGGALPPGSFLSCSSDDTIRLWTLDKLTQNTSRGIYQGNIYSDELLKSVYIDDELTFLKDTDLSQTNVSTPADKTETNTSYDSRNGVRCVKLSPDGKHLASGDRAGNIHIHETGNMKEILKIEAHDAEVLCLEYSSSEYSDHKLLVSASRDRLIHVFDVSNNYAFLQTLDDHSSSITAVRLLNSPDGSLQMVSCGADKCLIFRSLGGTPNGSAQFTRGNNATGKATLYDMEVDSGQKHVITACQDRNVRVYSVATGKHTKSFKGSTGDEGTLIKVALDRSGIYLATSCTDKSLSVYDYYTGECMATMCGHSELATGLRFTNDCKRLISASGDGCIFVWKVPHDMVVTMHARLSQQAMRQGKALDSDIFSDGGQSSELYESGIDNYRFSVGQLPQWARKRIPEVTSTPASPYKVAPPKGRWAQRAEENILTFYSANSVISFSSIGDRRVDSDGSKDSSLDSGTESRQYRDDFKQTPQTNITSNSPSSRLPSSERTRILTDDSALGSLGRDPDTESTAHDADIDSDHEYNRHQRHHHHQPLYYPSQIDSASGSEFTVTNIDADELRKSVRKSKRNFPLIPLAVQQPTSISGSQESDDDDDEASTPSGENTDRNPMSFLSVSSESLDQLSNREKYLQSTFESLSGVETMEASTPGLNKSSISSQYHTRLGATTTQLRNINVINATRQAKNDPDTLKKREELSKMIADTKKKLANVGHNSPLKYSKSIHDLSHIPERDKWGSPNGSLSRGDIQSPKSGTEQQSCQFLRPPEIINCKDFPYTITDTDSTELQPCGCHHLNQNPLLSITNITTPSNNANNNNTDNLVNNSLVLSDILNKSPERNVKNLAAMIKPRKLQLDKTLVKYKMHKSLPVSPVNEEVSFSDFIDKDKGPRKSFSYFVDFKDENDTDKGFREICDDIERFSKDLNLNVEDDDNFSSDSLEECSFNNTSKKSKSLIPPRRCVSNNEIYKYQKELDYTEFYHHHECNLPKSNSFYLNPSNKNSQDSILSEENFEVISNKSYCNSLESVLSNDSDCKSAPLEVLFSSYRKNKSSQSEINLKRSHTFTSSEFNLKNEFNQKHVETQTDLLNEVVFIKKSVKSPMMSVDFQKKLEKFEKITKNFNKNEEVNKGGYVYEREISSKQCQVGLNQCEVGYKQGYINENITSKRNSQKGISFVVETKSGPSKSRDIMHIPSLESKNKQYKSKYRNVLNNKPEMNLEIFESSLGNQKFTLTNLNFERNRNQIQETSSLDRHLLSKGLFDDKKVFHKPPKAIRRHSSKTRKKTYEYIKKEDFYKNNKNNNLENLAPSNSSSERTIEINYKEKNVDKDCENGNNFLLKSNNFDFDSLENNLNVDEKFYDSLETKNLWDHSEKDKLKVNKNVVQMNSSSIDRIQSALENIKILNEIQKKIQTINDLVECFKQNVSKGKVRALSNMYETMMSNSRSLHNNLGGPPKVRRRNLSLPNFVERRLNPTPSDKNQVSGKHQKSTSVSSSRMTVHGAGGGTQSISNGRGYNKTLNMVSMMKSSSTSALNQPQSDSEPEIIAEKKISSRLMRPTISSLNKLANKSTNNTLHRKRHAHSVMNLSTVGNGDTSSEDEAAKIVQKPVVPPRTRNLSELRKNSSGKDSGKNLRKKSVEIQDDLETTLIGIDVESPEKLDVSTAQLSKQLCDKVAESLTIAANNVEELYRRLWVDSSSEEPQRNVKKSDMVKNLELSIARMQNVLQDVALKRIQLNVTTNGCGETVNQTEKIIALKELFSKGVMNDQDAFVKVMQQYSDILLTMMHQKIQSD
nr:uncharacterized protein LOC111417532 isoform X2 [Onthophagus taurus]